MLQDASGQYRRNCGYKRTAGGKTDSARFYLGFEKKAAQDAEQRLELFWAGLERYYADKRDGETPLWEPWSMSMAQQVAKGKADVLVEAPDEIHEMGKADPGVWAAWLDILRCYFGRACGFELPNKEEAEAAHAAKGEYYAKIGQQILASVGKPSTGGTLHAAIDAYVAYLHRTHTTVDGTISQTGKKQGERAGRLKVHHADIPLYDLDGAKIQDILAYWSKRPIQPDRKEKKRYSRDTCKNQLILIRAMLRWMHRSEISWKLPADYLFPRMKIDWLPSELAAEPNAKRTFTLKEVGTLWTYATPLERVYIVLAINCGFGDGEIGTLAEAEINGKLIKRLRRKTRVFGAWWMFPVTREAIAYARKRKEVFGLKNDYLLVTEKNHPYCSVTTGNNRKQIIRNSFNRLIARIREQHDDQFPQLSFGKLRKTAASWIRKVGGGELASIFLSHGRATGDTLLEVYADRQFRKLFKCQVRLWVKIKHVFAGEFPAPTPRKPKAAPTEKGKKKVLKLYRQGYKFLKIAELTGITYSTCRRLVFGPTGQPEDAEAK